MKYSDIIGIEPFFDSSFDVVAEKEGYWKQFIPNELFEGNLLKILQVFTADVKTDAKKHKSVWIQGTYGTGKSHSTSVIKHLLSDDYEKIEDYIQKLSNPQLKASITSFRKEKRIFPIVLKSNCGITDVEQLKYVIQRETMKQLNERGITVTPKTDFMNTITTLDTPSFDSFWETELRDGSLRKYASSKEEIINKLNNGDFEILQEINAAMKKAHITTITENITDWLTDVKKELVEKGIADYLVLIWDEFTSLLDISERGSILNTVQDIAELSKAPDPNNQNDLIGVYIFLVTHKNMQSMDSYKELKEDEKEKAAARFLELSYDMHEITTYHILSNALKIKDTNVYEDLIKNRISSNIRITSTLDRITEYVNNSTEVKKTISRLYPLHPYTAYLATFVSRAIGSAERSIFEFLNDGDRGFKKFLDMDIEEKKFITPDYVWDFFYESFQQDSANNFDAITNKYNIHIPQIAARGEDYCAVFKVILLLNLLNRVTMQDNDFGEQILVNPSQDNIISALSGAIDETDIIKILNEIDESEIISRNPDNVFEVSTSSMPIAKTLEAKKELYSYYENVVPIFDELPIIKNNLIKGFSSAIMRETDVKIFWGGDSATSIENKLLKNLPRSHKLCIAIMLFKGDVQNSEKQENSQSSQKALFTALSNKPELSHIVIVSVDNAMGNKIFEGFVDSRAREKVATDLTMAEEQSSFKQKAEKWITNWVNDITSNSGCSIIFRGSSIESKFNIAGNTIRSSALKVVFSKGLELMDNLEEASTAWPNMMTKKTIENFICAVNRSELESKFAGASTACKYLLRDAHGKHYVFNDKLVYEGDMTSQNPIEVLYREMTAKIDEVKDNPTVDLGKLFEYLSLPEYGYYKCHLCTGAVALVMRQFTDQMYLADQGTKVTDNQMRDIVVAMFTYWEDKKENNILKVRFSTTEERELTDKLHSLFGVEGNGLLQTKWEVRQKFQTNNKAPLWALKYVADKGADFNDIIDKLFVFTKRTNNEIKQEDIVELVRGISQYNLDLKQAIKQASNLNCLKPFICMCLEESGYTEVLDDIQPVVDELSRTLSGEIMWWEEQDVKYQIALWVIRQGKPADTVTDPVFDDDDDPYQDDDVIDDYTDDIDDTDNTDDDTEVGIDITPVSLNPPKPRITVEDVKTKMATTSLDEDTAKTVLIDLCKAYPVICERLIELLGE